MAFYLFYLGKDWDRILISFAIVSQAIPHACIMSEKGLSAPPWFSVIFFLSRMAFYLFFLERDCDRSLISFAIVPHENSVCKHRGTFRPSLILFHFFSYLQ